MSNRRIARSRDNGRVYTIEVDPLIPEQFYQDGYQDLAEEQLRDTYANAAVQKALNRKEGFDLSTVGLNFYNANCIATATSNYPKDSFVTGNLSFSSNPLRYGFEQTLYPEPGDLVQFLENGMTKEERELYLKLVDEHEAAYDAYTKALQDRFPAGYEGERVYDKELQDLWLKNEDTFLALNNFKGSMRSTPKHMEIITGFDQNGRPLKSGTYGGKKYHYNETYNDMGGKNPNIRYYTYTLGPKVRLALDNYLRNKQIEDETDETLETFKNKLIYLKVDNGKSIGIGVR